MKNKGCAFEIKGGGSCRYYTSPTVTGLADFARFLYENRASAAGVPQPVRKRIPQAEEISETAWHEIADGGEAGYSGFFILDIQENRLWGNEDRGGGLGLYVFPFNAVLQEAALGTTDLWERLLAMFPHARLGGD